MKSLYIAVFLFSIAVGAQAQVASLSVKLSGLTPKGAIAQVHAYCIPDGKGKTQNGSNISPAIEWSGAPDNTRSFAIIMVDRDVPQSFELANQEGKIIPNDFPRQDFYHWVLVDVPPSMVGIAEGKASRGVTAGGKMLGDVGYGITGRNDYAKMSEGAHGGYDGPCPPWNDERLHNYHFIVYALDIPSLGLKGAFTGADAEAAMQGHILAKGEVTGNYSNYAPLFGSK